ncbi:2-succinyl-5-enolpyruvyl-6-hydroxy-3-cyclohexene-1-carboxylic-acid synthase [Brachybacterium sp. P6-10-X1]|uniref:2-succinyl-5-enolpyruvyl-6-hydroxy-3- cyclohexene-1-carboxylic-acid synthase n=1 Tax=Brachybacterium sp. P6-10-X1 TaxID=1903186 RepID=UPI000971813A|nr:2-succinyl-5-enolpyruvyl-6-hydroxy-3-cyclohexene-1-carboxylic-acid synthase [Brachybacterium sp. P6-10-X1]APX32769.1 2-succinyl-5-enolpyruvyl-6-hydroxy-3-cyclohexene-1-carboxylic-acid synthase [Brachybacterium sp. P6-10-X1]
MHVSEHAAPADGIPLPTPTGSGAVDQAIVLWSALAALGTTDAVLAPGSRSAPLVYGLADPQVSAPAATGSQAGEPRRPGRIRAHVRIDERAAAFTALGLSRHDMMHPAVVVTTSGTATAHLHAAVMEAHHARVPLIVLTADRPAELRDVGANQTTRQAGMFRSLTRFDADLPAPTAAAATPVELRTAVSTIARAVAAATGDHPGPVHLNLGFRDPLVPRAAPSVAQTRPTAPMTPVGAGSQRLVLTRRARPIPTTPRPVPISSRTVVVAGDGAGSAARELAERHTLPLLAEPSSGARGGPSFVRGYPALLGQIMADRQHPLRPDRAIVLGHPTLSRPVVGALLGAEDVDVIVVDPHPDWADAARRARLVVPAAIGEDGADDAEHARRRDHLVAWREAAAVDGGRPVDWQQRAALAVWEATGGGDTLVLGSSSLVRDLEQHAGSTSGRVIADRGLAGIDGTTSLAGGIALAQQRVDVDVDAASVDADTTDADTGDAGGGPGRVRVLMGDLTALHDLTGLIIGPEEQTPDLDVIVVDDGGGRIFSGLEHAAAPPALLRRFFTTPHGTDIAAAAAALGARARRVTPDSLAPALAERGHGLRMLLVQDEYSPYSENLAMEVVPWQT